MVDKLQIKMQERIYAIAKGGYQPPKITRTKAIASDKQKIKEDVKAYLKTKIKMHQVKDKKNPGNGELQKPKPDKKNSQK